MPPTAVPMNPDKDTTAPNDRDAPFWVLNRPCHRCKWTKIGHNWPQLASIGEEPRGKGRQRKQERGSKREEAKERVSVPGREKEREFCVRERVREKSKREE
jgi:hypothetical protein